MQQFPTVLSCLCGCARFVAVKHDVNTAILCNSCQLCVLQDNGEDSHRISPSPVVHVRGLCEAVVEADLIDALEKFGPIW